jgi:hypothetical protein
VLGIMRSFGLEPMPWQRQVSEVAGEFDPELGEFRYQTVDLVVPRQAGKTGLILPTSVQRGSLRRAARCWYTAQTRQDAADVYNLGWMPLIDAAPADSRRRLQVRRANGSERITLKGYGSTIALFAPGPKALHSKQSDMVTVDEVWAFQLADGETLTTGIRPTMATRPLRQLWRISAAGDHTSTWLDSVQESGRALVDGGEYRRRAYFEWSAPVAEGETVDIYDRDLWRASHPALGYTISESFLEAELDGMDPTTFARSYLCIPARLVGLDAIPARDWRRCAGPVNQEGWVVFAVDTTPDREWSSIAACSASDGVHHLDITDRRPGTDWVVPRLLELRDRWQAKGVVIDAGSPAGSLVDVATKAGIVVSSPTATEFAQSCGAFFDAVIGRTLTHADEPVLNESVAAAKKRKIGQSWGWERYGRDASPLVAATLARWGMETIPEPQPRRFFVGVS